MLLLLSSVCPNFQHRTYTYIGVRHLEYSTTDTDIQQTSDKLLRL